MLKNLLVIAALTALTVSVQAAKTIYVNHPAFGLSPYTWHLSQSFGTPSAEAPNPGAYFKTTVSGTSTIKVKIDGSCNEGYPDKINVFTEYSVDGAPFEVKQLERIFEPYDITLAEGLDPAVDHTVQFYFKSGDIMRWESHTPHLRIKGLVADNGASLKVYPKRSKTVLAFGDSITEGVGAESTFTTWNDVSGCNARVTWLPVVCDALDCEYGQVGSGGEGMWQPQMPIPPLYKSWKYLWKDVSRLKGGKLVPEPDYIFCNMGTNDYQLPMENHSYDVDIYTPYMSWLKQVRAAAPKAKIFCIVPPCGEHLENITRVVKDFNDKNTYLINVPNVADRITVHDWHLTTLTYDGVHPTVHGHAILGASIAVQIQKALDGKQKGTK